MATKIESVNTAELIREVAETLGITKKAAQEVMTTMENVIVAHVKKGKKVKLGTLGYFVKKDKKARAGVNPQTGEKIKIAASKGFAFKPSSSVKEAMNSK